MAKITYHTHENKNGFLDKLSEVQLISAVKNKRIPFVQWEKGFTTFPVGNKYEMQADFSSIKPRINVNLATFDEIVKFLEQFNQNTTYFINYSPEIGRASCRERV